MNWLAKRVERDRMINVSAPRMWDYLRMAMQDAAKTYRLNYEKTSGGTLTAEPKGELFYVAWEPSPGSARPRIAYEFSLNIPKVSVLRNAYGASDTKKILGFDVDAEGNFSWQHDGNISEDEACQLLLEPVMFPAEAKSSGSLAPPGGERSWMGS